MATIKMMQGDSYPIPVELKQDGIILTPQMVEDVEISVGESLRKTYSAGEVGFDTTLNMWYFIPSQQETFAMEADSYPVIVRVKYRGYTRWDVKGVRSDSITIEESHSKEEL